jgi:hypothetical protein
MTIFNPVISGGVNRVDIHFDSAFTSCTAKKIFAREVGHSAAKTFLSGKIVGLITQLASGFTCSIQEGNVLADR